MIRKPIFVVPLTFDMLVCDSADLGHAVSNLTRLDAIGLTWRSGAAGDHWIRGVLTQNSPVDFCSLISANATAATKIRLRLGTTEDQVNGVAPYDSGVLDFISPAIERDDGLYHSHLELDAAENATWFRIDITGHIGAFEAATLVLGRKIEPSRFYNWDFEFGIEDLGKGDFTPWGVFDEEPGLIFRTIDFTLAWTTAAEFEADFRPMIEKLGARGIVYLCFDPSESASRQAKSYLGKLKKPGFARGGRKAETFTQDYSLLSMI